MQLRALIYYLLKKSAMDVLFFCRFGGGCGGASPALASSSRMSAGISVNTSGSTSSLVNACQVTWQHDLFLYVRCLRCLMWGF